MARSLEATLFTIGDVFGEDETHYEIPIYQRNYAWGVEQIEQLIDDVWAAAQADADDYFLGNLVVARKPPKPDTNHVIFEVVDGQQRLTTLFMLLAHLGVDPKARLTYQSRRNATDALTRLTTSDDDEGAGIHLGFKVIESRMAKFKTSDERGTFQKFLDERVQLVRAVLPERTDLNKYFEIMNTRGQQLGQVDIVKARLMSYLRDEAGEVEAKRACLAWVWDACAEMDSYVQMALTPGDPELRDKIFSATWDRLQISQFDELLLHRPQASDRAGVSRSAGVGVRDALRLYAQAAEEPIDENSENRRFESPIKFPSLLLHALKVLRGVNVSDEADGQLDDSKLIKLFEAEFKPQSEEVERSDRVQEFVEGLLRCKFILDNYVIKREFTATNGQDGAWSLKRLTRGESVSRREGRTRVNARFPNAFSPTKQEWEDAPVDDATREVLLFQSMFRITYTSPRTMHWITRILREPVLGRPREHAAASIRKHLQDYARQKVREAYFTDVRPVGFNIERIVFNYLDYLLAKGGSPEFAADPTFTFVFRNSVEHFFPQHANREDDGWHLVTPDDDELHMFGNLALVSVSTNSKFSNNLPLYKANKTEIVRQSTKLQLMAKLVKSGTTWDKAAIRQHDHAMVDLLEKDLQERSDDV